MRREIKDRAIVLSRLDYGEHDRIITVLSSEHGKLRAIAKAVRSPKSKLAGGIELFAENELGFVRGRGELMTITSSRMVTYWGDIAKNTEISMYIYECLKNLDKLIQVEAGWEFYPYLKQLLISLNDKSSDTNQVRIWFSLKLLDLIGSSPNLNTLADNKPIPAGKKYQFDFDKQCFFVKADGQYSEGHIKILRKQSYASKPVFIRGCDEKTLAETEHLTKVLLDEHTR